MTVAVGLQRVFKVHSTGGPDEIDAQTDRVMDELLALEDDSLRDSAVGVDLGQCQVEIEIVGRGDTFEDALRIADAAIRSAIHAAGGSTPNWTVVTLAERAELVDA